MQIRNCRGGGWGCWLTSTVTPKMDSSVEFEKDPTGKWPKSDKCHLLSCSQTLSTHVNITARSVIRSSHRKHTFEKGCPTILPLRWPLLLLICSVLVLVLLFCCCLLFCFSSEAPAPAGFCAGWSQAGTVRGGWDSVLGKMLSFYTGQQ